MYYNVLIKVEVMVEADNDDNAKRFAENQVNNALENNGKWCHITKSEVIFSREE